MKRYLILYERNGQQKLEWVTGISPQSTDPKDFLLPEDSKIVMVLAGLNMVGMAYLNGKEVTL